MGPRPGRRPILSLKGAAAAAPPAPVAPPPALPKLPQAASAMLAKTKRKLAREAALKWLSETYPLAFGVEASPLALGVGRLIWPEAKAVGIRRAALNSALKHHTSSFRYLDALITDGVRFDLEGNAVEPVSAEHRQRAIEMKVEFDQVQRERAEARKGARS